MAKPADNLHKLAMSPHTTMDEAETLKHCKRLLDECERVLGMYAAAFPAFRAKPIGAPNSEARADQKSHMALEDMARATLAKLRGEA